MLRPKPHRRRRQAARPRRIQLEVLEKRQLLAASAMGVTPMDTGEFLLGTVAVTPVFFESTGGIDPQTQNWSPEEIDEVLAKVTEGVNWWSDTLDTLDTVHSLEFKFDNTYATNPVETPYEPIDNSSSKFNQYVGDFVTARGYGDANSIEDAVRQFNDAQRIALGTDWAFTIFVVDSSEDPDGLFASGGSFAAAFAFAGGLFMITPSTRPVSTIAHEMGHLFWARDEYSGGGSWTDQRGYYNTQNLNAADNPAPGFEQEISIMRGGVPLTAAFNAHVSPASTLAFVGWQDSDGDGIFDLADVPLHLDAIGYFEAEASLYHFSGSASAVPLINRNSAGPQSDITLNRVSQLQYSLDDGPWLVAAEPDQQVTDFDFSLAISQPFSTIRWRAIDVSTGITSPIVEGSSTFPAISDSSISGLAFVDENADGVREATERALAGSEIVVRNADGSSLFGGQADAADFPDGEITAAAGVSLAADGIVFDPEIGSFVSQNAGDQRVFHAFDRQRDRWIDRWSSKVALEARFDQAVGEVRLEAIGIQQMSFARLEAYDAAGQLIARTTSEAIGIGEKTTVEVTDSLGRIASIRALGHAGTSVALNDLRFGSHHTVVTDPSGAWRVQNLPDGNYIVDLRPERLIHQFAQSSLAIEVTSGASQRVVAGAVRVNSPRHNEAFPEDANQDGRVTSRDALVIINDVSRFNSRVLQPSETTGFDIDVNNDGVVSALDALLVINFLGRENGQESEESPNVRAATRGNGSTGWEAAPPAEQVLPMFNSAGGMAADTSAGQSEADTSHQAMLEYQPVGRKTGDFGSKTDPLTTNQHDLEREKAAIMEQLIDLIRPEISEPFAGSLI